MPASDEAIVLLRRIAVAVEKIAAAGSTAGAGHEIAPARELDSQYGNPVVKFDPRDWTGPSMKGRKFSDCPAEFLSMLAETFDYFAQKAEAANEMTDGGKPTAPYKRKDAARARGWARRIESGQHVPTTEPVRPSGWSDAKPDWQ